MFSKFFRRSGMIVVLAATTVFLSGCEDGPGYPEGEVQGRVVFKTKPVAEGQVTFYDPQTGAGSSAAIGADGTFAMPMPLRTGQYNVMVTPPIVDILPDDPGSAALRLAAKKKKYADIPMKVRVRETTPLLAQVAEGSNEIELELMP